MYCKNCGKEIKEGNTFCTNCGKPISNIKKNTIKAETEVNTRTEVKEKDNSNKQVIKLKLWHIVIITFICLAILVSVFLIINKKNNSEKLTTANDSIVQNIDTSNNTKYEVEIGKYYRYTSDREGEYSSILFNNNTGFTMKSGVKNSQEVVETGTYQIEDNKVIFTITYNSFLGDGEDISEEDGKIPYTIEMTILENSNLEYVTEYATCLYVKDGSNTESTTKETSADLLETIYAKYPEMKEKDGFICTNGEEYWLLDKQGKKIYFDSFESFESALVICYTSESKIEKTENTKTTSNSSSNKSEQKQTTEPTQKVEGKVISFSEGYKVEDYTEKLKEWGYNYKIEKVQNLDYDNNVVIDIQPNNEFVAKGSTITLKVTDNTYNMDVIVDTSYLVGLANIKNKYDGDKIQITLKINGNTIFNGETEIVRIIHSVSLGKIKGKTTDKYNIEATIDGVKITKNINYYLRCDSSTQRFEIYAGGDIGGG